MKPRNDSRQWPRRSMEVLFVRLLHKYKGQTRTLSLNWTFCHFLAKQSSQGLLRVPRGPKNRLWMSSDFGHFFVPFHPLPGVSLPFPSSGAPMAHWGPHSLRVLGGTQKRLKGYCKPSFPELYSELRGNIPPALVYLVQKWPSAAK